eukprot:COSAG06_NODE_1762_length_8450_cov_4.912346_4_plen_80_part_00
MQLEAVFLGFGASAAARCRFEAGSLILAIKVRLAAVLGWWRWRQAVACSARRRLLRVHGGHRGPVSAGLVARIDPDSIY